MCSKCLYSAVIFNSKLNYFTLTSPNDVPTRSALDLVTKDSLFHSLQIWITKTKFAKSQYRYLQKPCYNKHPFITWNLNRQTVMKTGTLLITFCFKWIIKQLHSAFVGGCYSPRPSASVDNTLLDLHISLYTLFSISPGHSSRPKRNRRQWIIYAKFWGINKVVWRILLSHGACVLPLRKLHVQ